jgi:predicted nucleic acid-binding protein
LEPNLNRLIDELIQERIASLDAASAQKAAQLAAQRKTQGRTVDLRDTLIAGIALAHQAQLATRNLRHFSDTGLSLINPFPEPTSQ